MNNSNNAQRQFRKVTLCVSPEALAFLGGSTRGVSHFAIFNDLLMNMVTTASSLDKRGIAVPLKPGQAEASANAMAARWELSRKIMTRLLATMQDLGLIDLSTSRLTSVATLTAVRSWRVENGKQFFNPSVCQKTV